MQRLKLSSQLDLVKFKQLAQNFAIEHDEQANFELSEELNELNEVAISLKSQALQLAMTIDFTAPKLQFRQQHGGGEAVVKACGVKPNKELTIIDATAGLGRDAFILASHGAKVFMLERNPAIRLLLNQALIKLKHVATASPDIKKIQLELLDFPNIGKISWQSVESSGLNLPVDVVYIDPMYPKTGKAKALVKKEMQIFQSFIGGDLDSDILLEQGLNLAKKVVVKRPAGAPFLAQKTPNSSLKTKAHRFDIYVGKL